MAETLSAEPTMIDALGAKLGTDVRHWWRMNATFLDLIRDNTALKPWRESWRGDKRRASTGEVENKIIADFLFR